MELVFYLIGNFIVTWAAIVPLGFWTAEVLRRQTKFTEENHRLGHLGKLVEIVRHLANSMANNMTACNNEGLAKSICKNAKPERGVLYRKVPNCVSSDLQIILFLGTILRCYWSCSPPVIWEDETSAIIVLAKVDVVLSPLVWGFLCLTVACTQERSAVEERMPFYVRWKFLVCAAMVIGVSLCWLFSTTEIISEMHYYGLRSADAAVLANMFGDAFAIIPQMYLATHDIEKPKEETSHFVGLLCIGRVFRMLFWLGLLWDQYKQNVLDREHQIWVFVLPDMIHCIVMGDFLWIWLKKLKTEQIDPMIERLAIV